MCVALATNARRIAGALERKDKNFLAECLEALLNGEFPIGTRTYEANGDAFNVGLIATGHLASWAEMTAVELDNYNRQYDRECRRGIVVSDLVDPFKWPGVPPGFLTPDDD